jgi:2-polyprenyl-3-methyl-5-hydroxy-6-metoxy-1,4-benzoquinol methylase
MTRKAKLWQAAVDKMILYKYPVQRALDRMSEDKHVLTVLEAGCGSASALEFSEEAQIAGIDICPKSLTRNTIVHKKILGDIQNYSFTGEEFDFIVCWNVLEHVPEPLQAVVNLSRALKPGGLMVLALPNVLSFEGMLTKFIRRIHIASATERDKQKDIVMELR